MHVIASFEYSTSLELALNDLERNGVSKDNILCFPLDKRVEQGKVFDSIHQSDGISLFDLATVLGMIFMLLGCIYGYILYLGPIIWALIGLVFGGVVGFLIDYFLFKKKFGKRIKQKKNNTSEVILFIECDNDMIQKVEEVLWSHFALGICRVENEKVKEQ